jgi:thymidylate kinase
LDLPDIQEEPPHAAHPVSASLSVPSHVARLLIGKLSERCKAYCILTGYEHLPDSFDSDIDFMVTPLDFLILPALIQEISEATGAPIFQVIPHEVTARAFRLVSRSQGTTGFIQPDSCSDYQHFGKLWLRSEEFLAGRRWHPNGFWIPNASNEFIYYLIKRTNKRDFTEVHGRRLSQLYAEDPPASYALLRRFWSAPTARVIAGMAVSADWQPLIQNLKVYRAELMQHSAESFPEKITSYWQRFHHAVERVLQPTGGWIAFIGPDGCGKSSVIEPVIAALSPAFTKVVRFHMRPKSLPARTANEGPVTDPHGQAPRSYFSSIAKMVYLVVDYWLGYLTQVRPAIVHTKLVVFDRYFYDILVDPKRIRYGGPKWLPAFLSKLLPKPEVVLLLNAPPEVLWSRKQEVTYEEVVRQQKAYLQVAKDSGSITVIDASQPLSKVVDDALEAIIAHFSSRARKRLKLT